ncbi:MAG: hypothetical protein O2930_04105 [Acidobacteria bacterium]|nr:hypothetical protein [Acidobacteriota bacterium]
MEHPEGGGHGSADDEYLATPPDSTYEHTDAHTWPVVQFLFWIAVSTVVIHFGLGFVYALMVDQAMETGQREYPLAVTQGERLPPAPRLQMNPPDELREFRQEEEIFLEGYGWMNRDAGSVHIPIEEAMRLTVEAGLPSRAQPPGSSGSRPSDSSGGRVAERSTP